MLKIPKGPEIVISEIDGIRCNLLFGFPILSMQKIQFCLRIITINKKSRLIAQTQVVILPILGHNESARNIDHFGNKKFQDFILFLGSFMFFLNISKLVECRKKLSHNNYTCLFIRLHIIYSHQLGSNPCI